MILMDIINLYDKYNSYFNADLKAIFECCSKIAEKSGLKIYLIGGMVRDMILNRETLDIDITVEGDAIKFAQILETQAEAKILSKHPDFGTVKIELNGQKIDLASTRSESYPKAGHLPHVDKIGCALAQDVSRRDFTINSLALSLNQGYFAQLIDYVGGFEDLKNKKIKILHDKSFIDDPTRIIRALKYSTRLGFKLDEKTLKLQGEYLDNINYDMCYKRVKQEIKKTFEQNSQDAFEKFIEQGIYKLVSSSSARLQSPRKDIKALIDKHKPKYHWIVYFGLIALQIDIENISFTKYEQEVIDGTQSLKDKTYSDDFDIYKTFCPQKLEALLILACLGKEKEVSRYLDALAKIKVLVSGNDLIKLGLKPSKKFAEIFDYILKEKLKNTKMTKVEELELLKNYPLSL